MRDFGERSDGVFKRNGAETGTTTHTEHDGVGIHTVAVDQEGDGHPAREPKRLDCAVLRPPASSSRRSRAGACSSAVGRALCGRLLRPSARLRRCAHRFRRFERAHGTARCCRFGPSAAARRRSGRALLDHRRGSHGRDRSWGELSRVDVQRDGSRPRAARAQGELVEMTFHNRGNMAHLFTFMLRELRPARPSRTSAGQSMTLSSPRTIRRVRLPLVRVRRSWTSRWACTERWW